MTQPNPYQTYPLDYGLGPKPSRIGKGLIGWVLFIALAITLVFLLKSNAPKFQKIALSDFYSQLLAGNISQVTIDGDELTGSIVNRQSGATTAFEADMPTGSGSNWACTQWLLEHSMGARVLVNNQSNVLSNILLPLVPWLLIFGFVWFFLFRKVRKASQAQAAMPQVPVGSAPFSAWVYPYQAGSVPVAAASNSVSPQDGSK